MQIPPLPRIPHISLATRDAILAPIHTQIPITNLSAVFHVCQIISALMTDN
jgi:hypothetical protein